MNGTGTVTPLSPEVLFFERSFRAIGTRRRSWFPIRPRWRWRSPSCAARSTAIDLACSRFRPDSEIEHLHRQCRAKSSRSLRCSSKPLLSPSRWPSGPHGAVDPTVGNAMSPLGYDCDFDQIGRPPTAAPRGPRPGGRFRSCPLEPPTRGRSASPVASASTSGHRPRRSSPTGPPPASPRARTRGYW